MFERFCRHLEKEWRTLRETPLTFIAALILLGAAIWWVMDWRYGDRLDAADRTIKLIETKLAVGPDSSAIEKIEKLKAKCKAKVEPISGAIFARRNKPNELTRYLRITAAEGTYGVTFYARGNGVRGLRIRGINPPRELRIMEKQIKDGWRSYFQNPAGMYEVIVVANNPSQVNLDHSFQCE